MAGKLTASAILALAVAAGEAPPVMEPGLWEVAARLHVPGSPIREATQTLRHCYTADELADARNALPRAGPGCEVVDYRRSGNRATWSLACNGRTRPSGGGEMLFGRYAYAATVWNEVTEQGRSIRITQRIRARRVGECLPEPAAEPDQ